MVFFSLCIGLLSCMNLVCRSERIREETPTKTSTSHTNTRINFTANGRKWNFSRLRLPDIYIRGSTCLIVEYERLFRGKWSSRPAYSWYGATMVVSSYALARKSTIAWPPRPYVPYEEIHYGAIHHNARGSIAGSMKRNQRRRVSGFEKTKLCGLRMPRFLTFCLFPTQLDCFGRNGKLEVVKSS